MIKGTDTVDTWDPRRGIDRKYDPYRLSSSSSNPAQNMLIAHSDNWPNTIERSRYHNAYSDRIRDWIGISEFLEIIRRHTKTGDLGLPQFVTENPGKVSALFGELMNYEVEAWRMLGCVNHSTGTPYFLLEVITPPVRSFSFTDEETEILRRALCHISAVTGPMKFSPLSRIIRRVGSPKDPNGDWVPEPKLLEPGHKPHVWNTGVLCSKHGQRMAAQLIAPNAILFVDVDQAVNGLIDQSEPFRLLDGPDLEGTVMLEYSRNHYKSQDALQHEEALRALRRLANYSAPDLKK